MYSPIMHYIIIRIIGVFFVRLGGCQNYKCVCMHVSLLLLLCDDYKLYIYTHIVVEIGFQCNNKKNKGRAAFDQFTSAYALPLLYFVIIMHI
jgi:hypothetical protein